MNMNMMPLGAAPNRWILRVPSERYYMIDGPMHGIHVSLSAWPEHHPFSYAWWPHCIALGGGHTRTFLSARRATDGGPPRAQPMPTEPPPAFNFVVVRSTRFFSFLVLGGRDREGQLLGTCSAAVPWEPLIAESNRLMKQSARHLKTTTYTL